MKHTKIAINWLKNTRKKYRSQPVIGRDRENFPGRDLDIIQKIYQDIQLDESNIIP
jgi:hypothetical protein